VEVAFQVLTEGSWLEAGAEVAAVSVAEGELVDSWKKNESGHSMILVEVEVEEEAAAVDMTDLVKDVSMTDEAGAAAVVVVVVEAEEATRQMFVH